MKTKWELRIRCGAVVQSAPTELKCAWDAPGQCGRCAKIEAAVNAILAANRAVLDLFVG